MSFDESPPTPTGYAIDKPARIVFDFNDIQNRLSKKKYSVDVGDVNGAVVVEGGGRTRVIVNLDSMNTYSTRVDGTELIIDIGSEVGSSVADVGSAATNYLSAGQTQSYSSSCLLYTSPSPRDQRGSRMPSSA